MRRGFTLVEMLVSTALVMLMMVLFAEIFSVAIGTITAQKGLANNDQKARSVVSLLTHDLDSRTYRAAPTRGATKNLLAPSSNIVLESPRGVVALGQGDPVDERQQGYLYFSENDPNDDTDDVLQWTTSLTDADVNSAPAYFFGKVGTLGGDVNQPDNDDGVPGDGASSSRAAEVSYFMRGKNLYRRVMLIRQPQPSEAASDTQPEQDSGLAFPAFTSPYAGSFYHDWDFSGTRVIDEDTNGTPEVEGTDSYRFHFHGINSLSNLSGGDSFPLGIPWNRFGFYSRFGAQFNRPVEYLVDAGGNPIAFVGRFTHEETSHPSFDWPGVEAGAGTNIMARTDLIKSPEQVVTIDTNANGSFDPGVDQPLQGNRTGEDILLTNVEAFDIEVWDPGYLEQDFDGGGWVAFNSADDRNMNGVQDGGLWVELGNSTGIGLFTQSWNSGLPGITGNATWGRRNATSSGYGPGGQAAPNFNRVFDTWHPQSGIDADGDGEVSGAEVISAPFRPLQIDPSTALANWTQNTVLTTGSVFFPFSRDGIGYVVVSPPTVGGVQGVTGSRQPEWSLVPGGTVVDGDINEDANGNFVLDPGEDTNSNSVLDVPVIWQCFDNRIGIEQIRITVRYRDVSTGQARQVTIVHSLVD